jgi:hypothetical protein
MSRGTATTSHGPKTYSQTLPSVSRGHPENKAHPATRVRPATPDPTEQQGKRGPMVRPVLMDSPDPRATRGRPVTRDRLGIRGQTAIRGRRARRVQWASKAHPDQTATPAPTDHPVPMVPLALTVNPA